ncbi:MAG: class I SAM-dependent methyltransferase [Halobacterium sp.]
MPSTFDAAGEPLTLQGVVDVRRAPYEVALEARVSEEPSTFRFETADGVCSKLSLRTAELLLAEALWDAAADGGIESLLVLEGNYGVAGTLLAGVVADVATTESSARAAALCRRNAAVNDADVDVALVADPASVGGEFDAVAYAPKPYTPLDVAAQRLANAASLLAADGDLYVAAEQNAGLSRYESSLGEIGGAANELRSRGDCSVLGAGRPSELDAPTYVEPRQLDASVAGVDLSLVAVPGVFSATELDHGTRLLAETAAVADGDRVLDLCCGYGALGAWAAKSADCDVWLTDHDRVATACAECSLDASGVEGTVVTADCLAGVDDRTFDAILSNPPTHAGDDVLRELFDGAADVLAADGVCWLVHHRDLDLRPHLAGFDRVERAAFDRVERATTGAEHVVLRAENT